MRHEHLATVKEISLIVESLFHIIIIIIKPTRKEVSMTNKKLPQSPQNCIFTPLFTACRVKKCCFEGSFPCMNKLAAG